MGIVYDIPGHNLNGKHYSTVVESVYKDKVCAPYENPLLAKDSPLYCVFYTYSGLGKIYLNDGQIVEMSKNVLFFGNQKTLLKIACESGEWVFFCYWFKPLNIEIPFNETILNTRKDEEPFIDLILEKMNNKPTEKAIAQINSLFLYRLFEWLDVYQSTKKNYDSTDNTLIVERLLSYIDFNLNEDLTVESLAAKVGFSTKHFRTVFRSHTGISPKKYILQKRLTRAKALLASSDLSIVEISQSLRFSSPYHLSNQFKLQFGVSPKHYQQTTQSKKVDRRAATSKKKKPSR